MNVCIVLLGRVLRENKNVLGKYGRSLCLFNQGVCGTGNTQRFWFRTILFSTLFGLSMFLFFCMQFLYNIHENTFSEGTYEAVVHKHCCAGVVSRSVSPSRCVSPSPRPRPKLPEERRKRAYTKSSPTSCCARTTEALWGELRFKTDFL